MDLEYINRRNEIHKVDLLYLMNQELGLLLFTDCRLSNVDSSCPYQNNGRIIIQDLWYQSGFVDLLIWTLIVRYIT